jgi:uncharacterized membrane protein YwzB
MERKIYMHIITVLLALRGFLFAFDTSVFPGLNSFIHKYFNRDKLSQGCTVTSIIVECALGNFLAGFIRDLLNKKGLSSFTLTPEDEGWRMILGGNSIYSIILEPSNH